MARSGFLRTYLSQLHKGSSQLHKGSKIQRILHNLIFSDMQNSLNFAGKHTTAFELST